MQIDTPKITGTGDFPVRATAYFGKVDATIELTAELKLCDVTDEDADRLIRAACAAKEANAAKRAEIASSHEYWKAGTRCLTCGKPEDDALHSKPEPIIEARAPMITAEGIAVLGEAPAGDGTRVYDPQIDNCAGSPGCGDQRVIFQYFGPQACCPRCYVNAFGGEPDASWIVTIPAAVAS